MDSCHVDSTRRHIHCVLGYPTRTHGARKQNLEKFIPEINPQKQWLVLLVIFIIEEPSRSPALPPIKGGQFDTHGLSWIQTS